ncbi:hypothetical protein RB25_03620 [Herbaspirillum rubrisubalbicans]|uniref:DUF2235 domain-containing protein n=1 Tax=Herbaspirillum rubrisubalbicans TaxID=80842 RepID=A0ABX9C2A4_9BURK|nr:hypothetical protein [Herbaspirillum rubrisubalbicans]RAM64602.1 hypothetical protein RB24_10400 [Herbaspirillum rubrisubalbicans]RAN49950.1 hypothetical protein RB25_03620 [Herbaspirillum rubrisubalbicans]
MIARFAEHCLSNILGLEHQEFLQKNISLNLPSPTECEEDIFLGFFFDGTNNNKYRDTPAYASSNIARLYEDYRSHPTVSQLELCKMSLLARMSPLRCFHLMAINSRMEG